MATQAEITALIETRVRAQRSHILNDGVADILDLINENTGGGPAGTTLYTGDGSLSGDRVVNLNSHDLRMDQGVDSIFAITGEGSVGTLRPTDGTAFAYLRMVGNLSDNLAYFYLRANDGTQPEVEIEGDAITQILTYTAGTHTFGTGDIVITSLAGGGTTGLSIDNDGKIIRTP